MDYCRINPCIKAELKKSEPMTREDEQKLFAEYSSTTDTSRKQEIFEQIIIANLKFVFLMASNEAKNCGVPIDDLFSEGKIGLVEAFNKYDPSVGIKFISFAVWYIRRSLKTYVSNDDLIRIPIALKHSVSTKRRHNDVNYTERESIADLVMSNIKQSTSASDSDVDDASEEAEDTYHDTVAELETDNMKSVMWRMLKKTLTENELYIIKYSFGLDGGVSLPASDIAGNLNMKKTEFQKVKKSAYEKVRSNEELYTILLDAVNV